MTIFNSQFSILNARRMRLIRHSTSSWFRNDNGFTLVETLVVSGIFIVVSIILIGILVIVLRSTKKSDSIVVVRQNGEQAMAQIIRVMRFAKSLDDTCPLPDDKSVTIIAADASQTVYTFTCPSSFIPPNFIDLNGTKLTNSDTVAVTACSFVCTQQAGSSPTIGISFELTKRNANGLPEENSRIIFKNSVTLRNFDSQ